MPTKRKAAPAALAMAHLTRVLKDKKASAARKDKAARLILTHADSPPGKARRAHPAAAAEKGKKDLQREQASGAIASGASKWAGLLQ